MNARKYVVLRAKGREAGVRGGVLGGIRGSAVEALRGAEVTAETATLSTAEYKDILGAPEVLHMAPVMPVSLVQPKLLQGKDEEDFQDVAGVTWGLKATGATASPFTGAGVTVAVLDTGIDAKHEAFAGKAVVQKDFTGEGDGDRNGHGTHCAGTLFGGTVGGVRIGVAPGISKALIAKVLDRRGSGSTEQILDGMLWAVREGANVVSMSIGFDFPGLVRHLMEQEGLETEPATSQALSAYRENIRLFDSVAELVRAHSAMFGNATLIAASGNESNRPRYEIVTAPPAAADGFISVGALQLKARSGRELRVAAFSNALPVVSAPGVGIRSARAGGGLAVMNGTSMATPHVAGVAALWLEQIRYANPGAHIRHLEGLLVGKATLEFISDREDRTNAGAGLIQAPRA